MAEKIKIFDSLYNPIGEEYRNIAHERGLWHQTFHCWIIRKRGDKYYVLFQKRSSKKSDSPNMLDITAAGHLTFEEEKEDGIREIKEELGIDINYKALVYLGIRVEVIEGPGFNNKEFQHVYLLENDTPLENFNLQEDEVAGLVEVDLAEGLKLFFGEKCSIVCNSVFVEDNELVKQKYCMHVNDVLPRIDGYYRKVLLLAYRYFEGDHYLSI